MINVIWIVAASSGIFALSLAGSARAATAVSGSMHLKAVASMANGVIIASNASNDSFAGAPIAMSIAASTTATDPFSNGTLLVTGQGTASGTEDAGSIHFKNYGWSNAATAPFDAHQHVKLADPLGTADWTYTFITAHDGTIDLSYNVFLSLGSAADGGAFGLQGWSIRWSGAGGDQFPGSSSDPTTAGVFTRLLTGGQTYTIGLTNAADLFTSVNFAPNSVRMSGDFTYAIRDGIGTGAVPEPATWTLMLSGFGLTGLAMRRRYNPAVSF